jgi:hypothetical protein
VITGYCPSFDGAAAKENLARRDALKLGKTMMIAPSRKLRAPVWAFVVLGATLFQCPSDGATARAAAATSHPNIILLESDDHHFEALGCMGDPVRTPHIDRLAARGILFTNNICQGTFAEEHKTKMVVDGRYKLVTDSAQPLLFDLREDPGEFHNLAGTLPKVESRLRDAIDAWLEATPPVREPNPVAPARKASPAPK